MCVCVRACENVYALCGMPNFENDDLTVARVGILNSNTCP